MHEYWLEMRMAAGGDIHAYVLSLGVHYLRHWH